MTVRDNLQCLDALYGIRRTLWNKRKAEWAESKEREVSASASWTVWQHRNDGAPSRPPAFFCPSTSPSSVPVFKYYWL